MVTLLNWKLFVNEKKVEYKSEYFERLVKESPFRTGDHGVVPKKNDMNWLDPELIRQGQEFVRKNFFAIQLAHFISLMMIFCFKSGRAVLLRTGESHRKDNSIKRYLSTILHIKLWYETDFIEKSTSTAQDVYSVRKMHGMAAKSYATTQVPVVTLDESQQRLLNALRTDIQSIDDKSAPWEVLTENPQVPMSQWDMVITQYCFLGFVVINPNMFGIWDTKGIEGFVHMWAVLGRLLGIDDRYNLALHFKDREAYSQIWREIFMPGFKTSDEYAIAMWDALIYGLSHYFNCLRLKSVVYFMIRDVAGIEKAKAKSVFNSMTFVEKYCYFVMFTVVWGLQFSLVRVFLNSYVRFCIFYGRMRYLRRGRNVLIPVKSV